jgi:hypothetical protein
LLKKTYRKAIRSGGGRVRAYWFPESIFSTLVDVWVVRIWLAAAKRAVVRKEEGG